MSITEIPPRNPVPSAQPPTPPGSDLYDASGWETAYSEMHDVPALLIQLQDDLSRSRQREAFWISVVVHLTIVILVVNSARLEDLLHKRSVVLISPQDLMKQKELTYLELPPDEQKLTKRPDTNKISDKDRIATSKSPQLDRKELKKILDSARPGRRPGAPPPSSRAPPAPAPQGPPAPQQQAPPQPPPRTRLRVCRLRRQEDPRRISALGRCQRDRQSNRPLVLPCPIAAAVYGGDGGDYGLGQGKQADEAIGPLDVLSDTMGVDFGPYLARVLHDVKENWYRIIPESARAPLMKKGKVSIEFAILKDGQVAGLQIVGSSGDVALDRAAYGGITASKPFPPLPAEFGGQYLALRFHFYYNPERSDIQ